MESKQPVAHKTQSVHTRPVYAGDYPSDPFKTAITGLKTFWENGKNIAAGVLGLEFLVLVAVWAVAFIIVASGIALIMSAHPDTLGYQPPMSVDPVTVLGSMQRFGPVGNIILVIFLVLILLAGVFVQALQTSFVGKTVALRQKPSFGEVAKTALKRMWPLLGQTLLLGLAGLAVLLVALGLRLIVNTSNDPFSPLIILPSFVALAVIGSYFFARVAFAGLGVVVQGMGPWQAIKHSFEVTRGRVGEVIGIGAVAAVATVAVSLIINLLQFGALFSGSQVLSFGAFLVAMVLSIVLGFLFMAIITERYVQFMSIAQTKVAHKTEWGSIVAAVGLLVFSVIVSGLMQTAIIMPKGFPSNPDIYLDDTIQPSTDQVDPNMTDEELQKLLDSLNQDSATGDALYQ
ncbi:MAG TPA: hypothetical protein VFT87_04575 [Candidatus Saccharimonadales bacterium]|nr:hypothetical protein [Candidatus Saccharimonadales bacterium]